MNIIKEIHGLIYKYSLDEDKDIKLIFLNILSKDESINLNVILRVDSEGLSFFNEDYDYKVYNKESKISENDYIEMIILNWYEADYEIVLYESCYIASVN